VPLDDICYHYNKRSRQAQWAKPHIAHWLAPDWRGISNELMDVVERLWQGDGTLNILNWRSDQLGIQGADLLSKLLPTNVSLTSLQLPANAVGDKGAIRLASALVTNVAIKVRRIRV
jgi:hypothetical protein